MGLTVLTMHVSGYTALLGKKSLLSLCSRISLTGRLEGMMLLFFSQEKIDAWPALYMIVKQVSLHISVPNGTSELDIYRISK